VLFKESLDIAVSTAKVPHLLLAGGGHVEPLPTFADYLAPTPAILLLIPIKPVARNTVSRIDYQSIEGRDLSGKAIVSKHPCLVTYLTVTKTKYILQF
jgi:hypothetical protein